MSERLVRIAIEAAEISFADVRWQRWASGWLDGTDRGAESALRASRIPGEQIGRLDPSKAKREDGRTMVPLSQVADSFGAASAYAATMAAFHLAQGGSPKQIEGLVREAILGVVGSFDPERVKDADGEE